MTRVLLFNTDLETGGTPTVVRELARRLPNVEMQVEVACLGRFGPTAEQIELDGGRVTAFDLKAWQMPLAVLKLRRLVREREIDTVLSFLVHANVVAAAASRRLPKVRWLQSIQTTQPYPKWHWRAQRWASKRAAGFIVPSQSIADAARDRSGIDPSRVSVIPNAVDAADVANDPRPPRDAASMLRVGFLGRLDPIKNVPDLVRAVLPLDRVELHVFGDGPDRGRIEGLLQPGGNAAQVRPRGERRSPPAGPGPRCDPAVGSAAKVTLHGFADRRAVWPQIDVLCLPSSAEGMPMVLIEAMAAGVPVVGRDAPGIRDVIERNRTGLLFDAGGLPDALRRIRDDPTLAATHAASALEVVRERYVWDRVLPLYREVVRCNR